jgi:hypothetical protein
MDTPIYLSSKEIVIPLSVEYLQSAVIDEYIKTDIEKRIGGIHNGEGIVIPGEIKILYRSPLQLDTMEFGGGLRCIVRYDAKVVDAPPLSSFVCKVLTILQTGILAVVHPSTMLHPILRVYIPMTIHNSKDQDRISSLRINDLIRVKVINRRGSIGDKTITVLASFVDLVERDTLNTRNMGNEIISKKEIEKMSLIEQISPQKQEEEEEKEEREELKKLTDKDELEPPEDKVLKVDDSSKLETFRGKIVIIPRSKDWRLIDETDKYSKEQRMRCKRETGKECTLYPFPAGMEVMKMFRPKRWLDPTAGWGDRLRVAIASGVEYVGVDSNTSMQSAYKSIIEDKAGDEYERYRVIEGKFQEVKIDGMFDLIFTSPPFFTVEIYENMVIWKDVEEYMEEFLRPLFRKSNEHLKKDGHIVLYIEDRPMGTFIDLMKEYVKTELPGLEYEGAFYYQGTKPRPYYVWVKRS